AKFPQELIWRHKERIVLKNTTDNHHWMRPHDVNHRVAAKLAKMISADDCVVVTEPHFVYTRLELNHVVDMRLILRGPIHAATNSTQRKSSSCVPAGQLFKHSQHSILVKPAVWKVDFGVSAQLQLPALLRRRRIDAGRCQAL